MTRSDYQREQRQMRRRIRELLAQRRTGPTGDDAPEPTRAAVTASPDGRSA
jgi:hypothetical protein